MILQRTQITLVVRPPEWNGDIKLSEKYRDKYRATVDAELGVELSPYGRWIVGLTGYDGQMSFQSYYADMLVDLLDKDASEWFYFDRGQTYQERKISVGALLAAFNRLGLDLSEIKRSMQEAKGQPQG